MSDVLQSIRRFLTENRITFREVHHGPTRTSEESARARGEPIEIGGKALVVKVGDHFFVFVMSAARKLDSAALRDRFNAKKARFATPDELKALTGLTPGCVPPFGRPILQFDLYVDESITHNERIAFNAGSLTDSIIMSVADYLRVAHPAGFFSFSLPGDDTDSRNGSPAAS
ncbi:MAG: hypothetical protein KF841_08930 [Phycisphaerae bacterium]|nr:hypothetical protein [Phycisphaerae bacterium]